MVTVSIFLEMLLVVMFNEIVDNILLVKTRG
nr:MAG TPA: hypothetical protein [Caudoviricetes sp.]